MATNTTFSSLIADLQNYLERGGSAATDSTVYAQLPRLVNQAERRIMNLLRLLGMIEILISTPAGLQASNWIVSKPDRWRRTVSMAYGTGATQNAMTPLWTRSLEYCQFYWPDPTVTDPANPPMFYADADLDHWWIAPTPPVDAPLRAVCYMQPPLLDQQNQSNFLSNYTPALLLYQSLLEAAPFLKDDPRITTWQTQRDAEAQAVAGLDLQRILDRASARKDD